MCIYLAANKEYTVIFFSKYNVGAIKINEFYMRSAFLQLKTVKNAHPKKEAIVQYQCSISYLVHY